MVASLAVILDFDQLNSVKFPHLDYQTRANLAAARRADLN